MIKKHLLNFVLIPAISLLMGCVSVGPQRIDLDRPNYNDVIQDTNYEQALKNIVRLRYVEASSYFQVTSVIASYSIGATVTGQKASSTSELYVPDWFVQPGVAFSDAPTISYTPITGSHFLSSLESSIDFDYFVLLSRGGDYSTDSLAKLMISKIGPLTNSASAVNLYVNDKPEYQEYYHFVELMGDMIHDGKAISSAVYVGNRRGILLQFVNKNSPEALELKRMVNIPADSEDMVFVSNEDPIVMKQLGDKLVGEQALHFRNMVRVQTRSINNIMTFLSHGVQVPKSELDAHVTMEVRDENGVPYNWTPLMRNVITIYSSSSRPDLTERVLVQTYVNGYWYYIKASDLTSKNTFIWALKLVDLVAAVPVDSKAPGLTLPT